MWTRERSQFKLKYNKVLAVCDRRTGIYKCKIPDYTVQYGIYCTVPGTRYRYFNFLGKMMKKAESPKKK